MDGHWRRLRLGIIAGDFAAVVLAYTFAAGARFGFGEIRIGDGLWPVYPVLACAVACVTLVLGWQYGTYRRRMLFGGHPVYPLLLTVATYGVVLVILLSYFLGGPPLVSRGWLVTAWLGSVACLAANRLVWRQVALYWRRQGLLVRKLLIAGSNRQGIAVAQQLHNPLLHGTEVVGFLDDYQRPGTEILPGLTVVGHPAGVLDLAQSLGADEVIIIAGALAWESQRLLAEMVTRRDTPIEARIAPTFYDLLTTSAELTHLAYVPMLSLMHSRLSRLNAVAKRALDLGCAAALLLALSPVWIYFGVKAWWRKLPFLERRPVLGERGERFSVIGLNPELTAWPVVARLPALWNVFIADLSLVGPRPIPVHELELHEPWLTNLFSMRPGLSGLWRLRGRELPMEDRVALDLYYIRNYSLTIDAQVLVHSAHELIRRLGGHKEGLARWEDGKATLLPVPEMASSTEGPSHAPAAVPRARRAPSAGSRL